MLDTRDVSPAFASDAAPVATLAGYLGFTRRTRHQVGALEIYLCRATPVRIFHGRRCAADYTHAVRGHLLVFVGRCGLGLSDR